MAARNKAWTPQIVRDRIRTTMLLKRLQEQALDEISMSPNAVKAATYLVSQAIGSPPQSVDTKVDVGAGLLSVLTGIGKKQDP